LSGRIEQFSQDLRLLIQRELPTTLRQNAKRQPSQDKRFRAAITTFADALLVEGCESRGQSDHQEVHMPRMYPATVRRQIVSRLRSGEPVAVVAADTGICQAKLFRWKRQALTDASVIEGIPSVEADELAAAHKRIAQLEAELALTRDACAIAYRQVLSARCSTPDTSSRPRLRPRGPTTKYSTMRSRCSLKRRD
jgi:transposase-like protein